MIPISPDLMAVATLLAEFSIQSLVTSMLPGLTNVWTVLIVVFFDMLSNFWRAYMGTSSYLNMKFRLVRLVGGGDSDPNMSRGWCWPFCR